MRTLIFSFVTASLAFQAFAAEPSDPRFSADRVRAHVTFLADDLLEGRDTGSRGHEIAARYVASQFESFGLKPGGDNGTWFQRITFQQTNRGTERASITITGPKGETRFDHATDVLVHLNPQELKVDVTAPLVFVGYGVEDKRFGLDDYRGLDVKGKVVVALRGYPKGLPSEEGAHMSAMKSKIAQQHGAIGMVSIATLQSEKAVPWERSLQHANDPDYSWVDADGRAHREAPGIRASAALHGPAAEAVFAGSARTLAAIRKEADKPKGMPRGFPLKTSIQIRSEGTAERVTSPNVIAILPGSDPTLASQYVILSAHLDHIGITKAVEGDDEPNKDRINNGALDNAAGVATMLEVARAAAADPDKPRRSIVFLATTAEEQGLLGADYFARHPTVPIQQIVGNVDLDMPLLLYPFTDVVAFGANHSTFGKLVADAVAPMNIQLAPDPMPEQGIFTRSDHYMLVRQGVPAVFLVTGFGNGGDKFWGEFLHGAYHNVGDDLNQKIDWDSGARFAEANYRITRAMADGEQPMWLKGDYFGDTFAPDAPRAVQAAE